MDEIIFVENRVGDGLSDKCVNLAVLDHSGGSTVIVDVYALKRYRVGFLDGICREDVRKKTYFQSVNVRLGLDMIRIRALKYSEKPLSYGKRHGVDLLPFLRRRQFPREIKRAGVKFVLQFVPIVYFQDKRYLKKFRQELAKLFRESRI
jgi:hypothetical protein